MKQRIVTKDWLVAKLAEDPVRLIGRALVAIFNQQTAEEQSAKVTKFHNGVGFTKADARTGALGAKYFLKHRTLEPWMLTLWLKPNAKGQPRIVKYASQLDRIARSKQTSNAIAILQTFNAPRQ